MWIPRIADIIWVVFVRTALYELDLTVTELEGRVLVEPVWNHIKNMPGDENALNSSRFDLGHQTYFLSKVFRGVSCDVDCVPSAQKFWNNLNKKRKNAPFPGKHKLGGPNEVV